VLFVGTFDYAMDERGRVPIPPRYRDAFRAGMVLSQGSPDRCVRLYTEAAFDAMAEKLLSQPLLRQNSRDANRLFFSTTERVQMDAQNRILVPNHLREYASLSGKIMLIGVGGHMEIWSPDSHRQELSRLEQAAGPTLESLEDAAR
jgi:MraZ protein